MVRAGTSFLVWAVVWTASTAHALLPRAASENPHAAQGSRAAKDPYAAEPAVVETLDTVYRYHPDGTGSRVVTEVARVQNQAGVRGLSVVGVTYPAERQRVELVYVRVRKPNGTVVQTPITDAQDQASSVTQAVPLYGDVHILRVGVRGVAVGDRVEYQIRTVFTRPEAKDAFWGAETFGRGQVVLKRTVELRVPGGKYVLVSSPGHPAQTSDEGAEKVYRWSGAQLAPSVKARTAPGQPAGSTDPGSAADDGRPAIAWTTFPSWAAVGEWYRGLTEGQSVPTPEISEKADQVVYGAATPDAKIRALYAFVSAQVRSIDLPMSLGGYQPHPAAEVLANQYGDSKDKGVLLAAMLRAEKLPVSTALVGAGTEVDESVPAPGWFNRVLTLTHDSEHGDVWMDTMPEIAPYRMLEASLRDKLALVIPATGPPVLRRTPVGAPFPESTNFKAEGTLNAEGRLVAHVKLTMRGDEELRYRQGLRSAGQARWDQVAKFYMRSAGIPGELSETVADLPEKTDEPLHVSFEYARDAYGDWDNFRIVPLEPGLNLPFTNRKSPPGTDIRFGGKRTDTAISRIALPAGFSADLPEAVHLRAPFATLDKTYRLEKTATAEVLVTDRTLSITQDSVPASDWPSYSKFLEEVATSEPFVQMTSVTAHAAPGHYPPRPGENNPKAADLVREAREAIATNDLTEATAKLDAARAIHPAQPLLWSGYAAIALREGKTEEAVADLRRELKEHPAEGAVSYQLATVLEREGKTTEAVEDLRAALTANPQDGESATLLATLVGKADLRAAEETLRAGLGASPNNLALKLALGHVLLQQKRRDEAAVTLSAVATESQNAAQLNDAAYELAESGLNLKVAEAAALRAMRIVNVRASRSPNGVGSEADLRATEALVACWDTYGWVLFQEGSYSEAEPWLQASWIDGRGAETGSHLARLFQKEGRPGDAARVLSLAGAGTDPAAGRTAGAPDVGVSPGKGTAGRGAVARMAPETTFAVPRAGEGPSGTALFEIDYSLNGPPRAQFVSGDADLEDLADALGKVNTRTVFPPGSAAHLLRRGILTCGSGATCSLRMLSPRAALPQ